MAPSLARAGVRTNSKTGPLSPRDAASQLGRSRRDFLRDAAGMVAGTALLGGSPFVHAQTAVRKRKVIVITFGGGARDQETFAPEGQINIPHMLGELAPQSSFFTRVTNQGILGHYVATASLATGVYETLNNFSAVPPDHPLSSSIFARIFDGPSPTPGWSPRATGSIASARVIAAPTVRDSAHRSSCPSTY